MSQQQQLMHIKVIFNREMHYLSRKIYMHTSSAKICDGMTTLNIITRGSAGTRGSKVAGTRGPKIVEPPMDQK